MTDPEASRHVRMRTIEEVYGAGLAEHFELEGILGESLGPRGLNPLMFGLVESLGLPSGASVLDVGAREGFHCIELARRFGFEVLGVEPLRSHLDNAAEALRTLAATEPDVAARVRVEEGVAERLAVADGSVDLIWCRDVLVHVEDLRGAFAEMHRALRPGGHALIFIMTATAWLTPDEAARLWPSVAIHAASTDPKNIDAAIASAGLNVEQRIDLHGEAREFLEEEGAGRSSLQLLHVSRLLRNREAYVERFGTANYDSLLANALWGVYQMIGKLNPRVYLLRR